MRSTRNQPFCRQEKKINRLLRTKYTKSSLAKIKLLYATITEIDSDFNGANINYYTQTISTYSGLSTDYIPKGLKILAELNIIKIHTERNSKGQFIKKEIEFLFQ